MIKLKGSLRHVKMMEPLKILNNVNRKMKETEISAMILNVKFHYLKEKERKKAI